MKRLIIIFTTLLLSACGDGGGNDGDGTGGQDDNPGLHDGRALATSVLAWGAVQNPTYTFIAEIVHSTIWEDAGWYAPVPNITGCTISRMDGVAKVGTYAFNFGPLIITGVIHRASVTFYVSISGNTANVSATSGGAPFDTFTIGSGENNIDYYVECTNSDGYVYKTKTWNSEGGVAIIN